MPDCFISYSSADEDLAYFVHDHLCAQGLDVFMASISLLPGENWTNVIWNNLRASPWVIFLASRAACRSAHAQQELGGALAGEKKIVPIVWEIPPEELPGWLSQYQALDLRGHSWEDLAVQVTGIAVRIRADKAQGTLIAGAFVFGLLWLASKKQ